MAQVSVATVVQRLEVNESLEGVQTLSDAERLRHGAFDRVTQLEPNAAGPWTALTQVAKEHTFDGSGQWDLDFTAAPATQGPVNVTGQKPVCWLFAVPNTNQGSVTIAPGPSNGYTGFNGGNVQTLPVDTTTLGRASVNGLAAVGATNKVLRFTGMPGDKVRVQIVLGTPLV